MFFNVHDVYSRPDDWPGEAQMRSIRFVDPAFVTTNQPPDAPRLAPGLTADGRRWNVLIFVLESTGADYVFDTSLGNETPMPFLQKMTRGGLYLANHHASANDSVQAASPFSRVCTPIRRKKYSPRKKSCPSPRSTGFSAATMNTFSFIPPIRNFGSRNFCF
jgi:hypothetical protein